MNAFRLAIAVTLAALLFSACRDFDSDDPKNNAGGAGEGGSPAAGSGGTSGGRSGFEGAGDSGAESVGGSGVAGATGGSGVAGEAGAAPQPDGGGVGGVDAGGASLGGEAGAGGAAGGIEPLSPAAVAGLVSWISADDCVSGETDGRVALCPDASDEQNDAVQDVASFQPELRAASLNGHAVLEFDGYEGGDPAAPSVLLIGDAASLHFGTEDLFIALVARWRNDPVSVVDQDQLLYWGFGQILSKVNQTYPYPGVVMFANYPSGYVHVPAFRRFGVQLELGDTLALSYSAGLNDNVYRVYALRRVGDDRLELRISGRSEGGVQVPPGMDLSATGQSMTIGGVHGQPFRGDLAEMVIIRGALAESEVAGLELALKLKYGLSP